MRRLNPNTTFIVNKLTRQHFNTGIMKLAISGSTGMIGRHLRTHFEGREIRQITRADIGGGAHHLADIVSGADVVINLAGASISKRWTSGYKQEILQSRAVTSARLAEAIALAPVKPGLFISASATGIYDSAGTHTEVSTGFDKGFMGTVCRSWEEGAMKASPHCRVVILRIGVVIDGRGGMLKMLMPLFRAGLGATLGNGRQLMPWIHREDLMRVIDHIIKNDSIVGPVNAVSPGKVNNQQFSRALGRALQRPVFMRIPAIVLRLMMGERADIILKSQDVEPGVLQNTGFHFGMAGIEKALTYEAGH
jgi:hypothetical protein